MGLDSWVDVKTGYASRKGYSVTGTAGGVDLYTMLQETGLIRYVDLMGEKRVAKAATRAINKGLVTLRSVTTKNLSRILAVRQKDIRATFLIKKARFTRLEGSLQAAGPKAIQLYEFSPSPRTPEAKKPRGGVSVRIRRDRGRIRVKGSFIARSKFSGKLSVFKRVRDDRSYPIRRLWGPAPMAYLLNDTEHPGTGLLLVDQIDEDFDGVMEKYLAHELEYELNNMPKNATAERWK
jgi:hypothetical protein